MREATGQTLLRRAAAVPFPHDASRSYADAVPAPYGGCPQSVVVREESVLRVAEQVALAGVALACEVP